MYVPTNCSNCGNPLQKKLKEFNNSKTKRFFCNRSCAASFNNKMFPKKHKTSKTVCQICQSEILYGRLFCKIHSPRQQDYSTITYGKLTQSARYQKNAIIRQLARKKYMSSKQPKICKNCSYSKHVEICHIKAISEFTNNSFISEINDISNLVALCPNCHWEFDNNFLSFEK